MMKNIEKVLNELGITLYDEEGNMRSFDTVMSDIGYMFTILDKHQKEYVIENIFEKR